MRFYLLLSTAVILLNNNPALAANLEVNLGTHTHLPLELKSTPSNSFKIAAICALGDNDCGKSMGFDQGNKDSSTGAKKCKDNGFNTTSCPTPKLLNGKCSTHSSYYKSCVCPSTLTLSNNEYCTQFCDGKCTAKANCPTNQIHNSSLSGCYQPTCSEGGYKDSVPSNNKCTATTYYGRNCYSSCYQPQCSEGGYTSSTPSNNKCSTTNYYGRNCYFGCYQPACSEAGYYDSTPSGQSCSPTSYYGRTCYTSCQSNPPASEDCYWNADGTRYISSGVGCYDGYGAYATIVLPSSGINLNMAAQSFWDMATIQGGPLNTKDLWVGMHANLQASHAIFNVPVTVNGVIYFSPGSTMKFNQGIRGNYICKQVSNNWNTIRDVSCPF